MSMRMAASSMLSQGQTPDEQLGFLRRCGFSGMELRLALSREDLSSYLDNLHLAMESTGLQVCSLITPDTSFGLAFDSREAMEAKLSSLIENLHIAGPLGAVSLFCPEYRPQDPLPLWNPPPRMTFKERALLLELLSRAADMAEKVDGRVVIEPLNRYETHLVHRIETAAELCEAVGSPRVGILADFYHMNLEEADMEQSITSVAEHIFHVQLGDSNRLLPGQGHLAFQPGFRALRRAGYDGFMALECRAQGPLGDALSRCVEFVTREWAACGWGPG